MIVNDSNKLKHYDGDKEELSDAIEAMENVKKSWFNSEYGILYTFNQKTLTIYVRNERNKFKKTFFKDMENDKWALGKVYEDYLYLNVEHDIIIWSISQDKLAAKFPSLSMNSTTQLNRSSKFIDENGNLNSFVSDPPMKERKGQSSKPVNFCNGEDIKRGSNRYSREGYDVVDWISQTEITILSSEKDDTTLILGPTGKSQSLKGYCKEFRHRMIITNGDRCAYVILTNYGVIFIPGDNCFLPTLTKLDGKLDLILPCY